MLNVPPQIYMYPTESSSLFSACRPSSQDAIFIVPSATSIASCASKALPAQDTFIVLPVIFKVSLLVTALSEDDIFNVPTPLITRSSFEKITASRFAPLSSVVTDESKLSAVSSVSNEAAVSNVPVTSRVLSESVVVTNTLSALFT